LRLKLASVLLVVLLAIVAGCGGSSETAATTEAETTVQATTTEETTTAEETTVTEDTTAETTTETDSSATGTGSFASSANCLKLLNLSSEFAKAAGASGGNDLDATAKFFQKIADNAPDEIQGDFQIIAKAFTTYLKALDEANFKPGQTPTPAQIASLTKAAESFNQAEVTKASAHIDAWAKKNCSG
jgi:hypothetical protein